MKSIVDHRKKYAYFHLYKAHSELYGKTDKMTTNIWTNEFNFKYIKNVCLQNNVLRTKKFQDVITYIFPHKSAELHNSASARSSSPEVFSGKGVLKICCKFTEEHPCRSAISRVQQLYWNLTLSWVFSCKFAACFRNTFSWEHLWRAASEVDNSCLITC